MFAVDAHKRKISQALISHRALCAASGHGLQYLFLHTAGLQMTSHTKAHDALCSTIGKSESSYTLQFVCCCIKQETDRNSTTMHVFHCTHFRFF